MNSASAVLHTEDAAAALRDSSGHAGRAGKARRSRFSATPTPKHSVSDRQGQQLSQAVDSWAEVTDTVRALSLPALLCGLDFLVSVFIDQVGCHRRLRGPEICHRALVVTVSYTHLTLPTIYSV